jgi:hypothetical protein
LTSPPDQTNHAGAEPRRRIPTNSATRPIFVVEGTHQHNQVEEREAWIERVEVKLDSETRALLGIA